MSVNEEPVSSVRFVVKMPLLLFVPLLAMGLFVAAVSEPEDAVYGLMIVGVVGLGAVKLRNEIQGMRSVD